MNIRIKELFKSDLDPNSSEWWAKDKLDKINFNFELMKNGGPSGPHGIEGPNGEEGEKGFQGVIGDIGPRGAQGLVGPESSGTWKSYNLINGQRVIYPSVPFNGISIATIGASGHFDLNGDLISPYYGNIGTSPISIAGSGALNIITGAPESYIDYANFSDQNSITFQSNGISSRAFNMGIDYDSINDSMFFEINPHHTADFNVNKFNIEFDRDNIFNFNGVNNANIFGIDSVIKWGLEVEANGQINQKIEFRVGEIKYMNNSPGFNKLLKSTDALGTVVWENVSTLFSILPIGSIIRIPSNTFFNESNFNLSSADTNTIYNGQVNQQDDIRTNFGSGKSTGMYGGWYLCNGEKWGDGGLIGYDTPNLNGFEWEFDLIPGITSGLSGMVQGGSLSSYNGNIIFSGGISTLGASVSGVSANSIGHSFDNNMDDIRIYDDENILFAEDKHVILGEQISLIYLKEYDYKWGSYDANNTTSPVNLQYHAMTGSIDSNSIAPLSFQPLDIAMQYATSLEPQQIEWTAGTDGYSSTDINTYWNTESNFQTSPPRCYVNGQELSDGWLVRESGNSMQSPIPRYARKYINGYGISPDVKLETKRKTCWMIYDDSVNGVDGTATELFPSGSYTNPDTVLETDIDNNTTLNLQEVFISNEIENHPSSTQGSIGTNFTNYENTTHIWKVDAGYTGGSINQLTDGWYRSLPYTSSYSGTFGSSIPAGYFPAYRKYWDSNDNQFKGDAIKSNAVHWSTHNLVLASGTNSQNIACNSVSGNDIFYGNDMFQFNNLSGQSVGWEITNLSDDGNTNALTGKLPSWKRHFIYVREDGSSVSPSGGSSTDDLGKYPLLLVKSDTYIPGTGGDLKIADWPADSGTSGYTGPHYRDINSNSKSAGTIQACSGSAPPPPGGVIFDWDDSNSSNQLNYIGSGTTGNVYFTYSLSNSTLSNDDFDIELPLAGCTGGYPYNSASVSYTAGDNYVQVSTVGMCEDDSQQLTLSFLNSAGLTMDGIASDMDIDITFDPCHVEGTIISMANGTTKLVENLKVGDVLDSFDIKGLSDSGEWRNFKTNVKEFKAPRSSAKIVRVIKGTYTNYQDINNGLTKITNEHPILIKRPDGEILFKQALYIDTTDMIYVNEKWTRVISNETIHKTVKTYSIDVENEDVYIADGILCHNIEEEKIAP